MIKTIFHLFIISFTFIVSADDTTKDNPIDALVQLLNSDIDRHGVTKIPVRLPAICFSASTKPENIIKRGGDTVIHLPVSTKPENIIKEAMHHVNTYNIIELKKVNVKKLNYYYDYRYMNHPLYIDNPSIALIEYDNKDTVLILIAYTKKVDSCWTVKFFNPSSIIRSKHFQDTLRAPFVKDSIEIEKVTALANPATVMTTLTSKNKGVINYSWKIITAQKFHYKDSLHPILKPGETYIIHPSKFLCADVIFFIPKLFQITNNSDFVFRYSSYYHYDDELTGGGAVSLVGKIKKDVLRIMYYTATGDTTKNIPRDQNDYIGYVKNDSQIILNFYKVNMSARDTCRPYNEHGREFIVNGRVSNDSLINLIKTSATEMRFTDTIKYRYRYYNVTKYQIVFNASANTCFKR